MLIFVKVSIKPSGYHQRQYLRALEYRPRGAARQWIADADERGHRFPGTSTPGHCIAAQRVLHAIGARAASLAGPRQTRAMPAPGFRSLPTPQLKGG
jgi:hypothetical protein